MICAINIELHELLIGLDFVPERVRIWEGFSYVFRAQTEWEFLRCNLYHCNYWHHRLVAVCSCEATVAALARIWELSDLMSRNLGSTHSIGCSKFISLNMKEREQKLHGLGR